MQNDEILYQITYEDIKNKEILFNHIYLNDKINYYISDDFSKEFYIQAASCGFICTSIVLDDKFYLLPEIQFEYAILDFEDLHIGKKIKKLFKRDDYVFYENYNLEEVLEKIDFYHKKDNWLVDKYKDLILSFKDDKNPNFQIKTFELRQKDTKELIAGEVGYVVNKIYTSLTGFCSKEKRYNNYGKLQLVLLAKHLEKNHYRFWNLGHPYMQYKFDLGAKEYTRLEFLERFLI